MNITTAQVDYRGVNLGYEIAPPDKWVPAEDILILRDGLKRPALYRPDNGEFRALLERDTREEDSDDESYEREDDGVVLDYEKRGKYIDQEETDISAIQEVERQLADKEVLRRAVAKAERCVPTQSVQVVADALSALAISK